MKGLWFIFLFILFLLPSAYAEDFYADVNIEVSESGTVSINGLTNHPELSVVDSHLFTSKNKQYWLLNISLEESFSDYIFDLYLPEDAVINYLKINDIISIQEKNSHITITGSGTNEPFSVIVQYSIQPEVTLQSYWWLWFIGAGLIILGIYLVLGKNKVNKQDYSSLTERQLLIVKCIEKAGGIMTQNKLQEEVGLPKASLSRNINSLVRKGLLRKKQKGMTNSLSLQTTD